MVLLKGKKEKSFYATGRYLPEAHDRKTSFSSPYTVLSDSVEEINPEISHPVIFP